MRGKFAVNDLQISELRAAAPDRNDTPSKKIKNTIKYKNLPCSAEAPSAKWRSSHSRPALLVVQREVQSLSEAAGRRLAPSAAPWPAERQIASGLQLHAMHRWPISAIDFRREPWCGQIWIVRVESGVCVFCCISYFRPGSVLQMSTGPFDEAIWGQTRAETEAACLGTHACLLRLHKSGFRSLWMERRNFKTGHKDGKWSLQLYYCKLVLRSLKKTQAARNVRSLQGGCERCSPGSDSTTVERFWKINK